MPNADVLYVGSASALYKRTAPPPAELIQLTAYPGTATITGVTVNPRDYDEVWVTDASNVYRTIDGGASWSNVTRDLATFDVGTIQSVEWFGDVAVAGTNEQRRTIRDCHATHSEYDIHLHDTCYGSGRWLG